MHDTLAENVFGIEGLDIKQDAGDEQPGDDTKKVKEVPDKKALHRKMRRLGMGKHAAGNAQTLANHQRVPGEIAVGQNKTLAQVRADKRAKAKNKNKMARKSRARNRR